MSELTLIPLLVGMTCPLNTIGPGYDMSIGPRYDMSIEHHQA